MIHSKRRVIFLCFGSLTATLPVVAGTFTLPPYDTGYPGWGTLYTLWHKNRGEVFAKAYGEIHKAITTGKDVYEYNGDNDEKRQTLGCFNAYFGTSLWRSRPKLTHELLKWLPASGRDEGDSYGCWKQFSLDKQAPGDLGVRIPEVLSVQREKILSDMRYREMEVASDMDYLLEQLSWNEVFKHMKDEKIKTTIQYVKDCLCVLMSEEFLRKIFTDPMVDLLLEYQQEVVDKKKINKPDGRKLELRYDVIPRKTSLKGKPKSLCFLIKMHLYDIHESTEDSCDQYKKGERGCILIPALDGDGSEYAKSRKNLNITLEFVFDAELKKFAVFLRNQIVINAEFVFETDRLRLF